MKKNIFLSFLWIIPLLASAQYRAKAFQMDEKDNAVAVHLGIETRKDTILTFAPSSSISKLYVSGKSLLENDNNSYIRLVLIDDYNSEYLIYELYPLLADSKSEIVEKTAIETKSLSHVIPRSIRIEVSDASFSLDSLFYVEDKSSYSDRSTTIEELQVEQNKYIIERLNANLEERNIPWRAGMTGLSRKTFEEKREIFGGRVPNLAGFDYYVGGIFITPNYLQDAERTSPLLSSGLVNTWDWRNRHGKNWISSVKDQANCGSCWAFATIGALESYINLYYNQIFNYDLSEQELVSCSSSNGCLNGSIENAMHYIEQNGIVLENCFSYSATNGDCDDKCSNPSEIISLTGNGQVHHFPSQDDLKRVLFRSPIAISVLSWSHALVLIGYKTLEAGDKIFYHHNTWITLSADSPYIGQTAWLVKNSWGTNWGDDGYAYLLLTNSDIWRYISFESDIQSLIYTDADILCEDSDGDGYWYWGIGRKPAHCPNWVPDTPDGDDSDYTKGPLDENGFPADIPSMIADSIIYITQDTEWSLRKYVYHKVYVYGQKTLRITNDINFYRGTGIYLASGSKLIVDGGSLIDVSINFVGTSGTSIEIIHDGSIKTLDSQDFAVPLGVSLIVQNGKIE